MRQHSRTGVDECFVNVIIPLCGLEPALAIILSHYFHLSCSTVFAGELYTTASISCLYATYLCCKIIGEQNDQVREGAERGLEQPIRNLQQLIRQREELERAIQESIANQSQGRTQLTREELIERTKLTLEILKEPLSDEELITKLINILITTRPYITKEDFNRQQLFQQGFPEIKDPTKVSEKLKQLLEILASAAVSCTQEEKDNINTLKNALLQELTLQTLPQQQTMQDSSSSSDSEPENNFRNQLTDVLQRFLARLLDRDIDYSDSESDRSSSSDGFRGVASAGYEQLSEQPQQQAMR